MAGAIYRPVPLILEKEKWSLDPEIFRKTLTPKTKLVILNNAHNPTGKIFTKEELEVITEILNEFP